MRWFNFLKSNKLFIHLSISKILPLKLSTFNIFLYIVNSSFYLVKIITIFSINSCLLYSIFSLMKNFSLNTVFVCVWIFKVNIKMANRSFILSKQTLFVIHFVSFISIIFMAQQTVFIAPRFLIKFEFKQIRRIEFILDEIFCDTLTE